MPHTTRSVDLQAADRFLALLLESAPGTFQTFDDNKARREANKAKGSGDPFARILHGRLDALAELQRLNSRGAGVYITVNRTDGHGRLKTNITGIRAAFLDLDGAPLAPVLDAATAAQMEPHAIIESSPGKFHVYWMLADCPLQAFPALQRALARRFSGDPSVCDLPRVMRVPGFWHCKAEPFQTGIHALSAHQPIALAALVSALALDLDAHREGHHQHDVGDARSGQPGAHPGGAKIRDGEGRRAHLVSMIAQLHSLGLTAAAVRAGAHAENAARFDPPKADAEVDALVSDLLQRYEAQHGQTRRAVPGPDNHDGHHADNSGAAMWGRPGNLLRHDSAPPLDPELFPPIIAHYATQQAASAGHPAAPYLMAMLHAVSACLDGRIRIAASMRLNWYESPTLWVVLIGPPASAKSPALKIASAPLLEKHESWWREYSRQLQDYEEAEKSGMRPGPKPIKRPIIINDTTIEGLADVLAANHRGVMIQTEEMESWISSFDAYRPGNANPDRGHWLTLYDGGGHHIERIKRGASYVDNWRAPILTATTPAALKKLAARLPADGLFARFMPVLIERLDTDNDAQMDDTGDVQMADTDVVRARRAYDDQCRALMELRAPDRGHITVRLTPEAALHFRRWVRKHPRLLSAAERAHSEGYAAFLGKGPGMLMRLALTLHCATIQPDENGAITAEALTARQVDLATIERALQLLRAIWRQAAAVHADLFGNGGDALTLARQIARSLVASERCEVVRRSDLRERCRAFRGADEHTRREALQALQDWRWLDPIETARHFQGAPSTFAVNPLIWTLFEREAQAHREGRAMLRDHILGYHGHDHDTPLEGA